MGVWGFLTAHRVPVWAADDTLWAAAVAVVPQMARPHLNLCVAVANTGQYDRAWAECSTAVGLTFDPRRNRYRSSTERGSAQAALAMIAAFQGHPEAADRMLAQVAAEWPNLPMLSSYRAAIARRRAQ